MKSIFIFLLFALNATHTLAQTAILSDFDPANGNRILDPKLKDYSFANRAPGILVEPYDLITLEDTAAPDSLIKE